jgi:hypothetical protein
MWADVVVSEYVALLENLQKVILREHRFREMSSATKDIG